VDLSNSKLGNSNEKGGVKYPKIHLSFFFTL